MRSAEPTRVPIVDPIWSWPGCGPKPETPPFSGGTLRADVAIIGAGFCGLSAALHILQRRPECRVVVLEAAEIGAGASGRTTGMLSPGVGQNLIALTRRLGFDAARRVYQATLQAVRDVVTLIEQQDIDCELALTGQLWVARSLAGQRRLHAQAALMQSMELPIEVLDEPTLHKTLRLLPLRGDGNPARPPQGPAALRLPVAGVLHPLKLLNGLCERIQARGGRVLTSARVESIERPPINTASDPVRLLLRNGEVHADRVVVATAGYTPQLGLLRGRLLPVKLQALVTEPLDDEALAAIGWSGREGVLDARRLFSYFRLTRDRRIVFGGERPRYHYGGSVAKTADEAQALSALAAELHRTFPGAARLRIAGGWSGLIGYVLDALPLIERLPDCPRIVQAVGWCGHGVALATASGAWIAHLLIEDSAPSDLPWFRTTAPLVPTELARWIGFRASVGWMAAMDRFL